MDYPPDNALAAVQRDLYAWQETHPQASFAEIELAVEQQLNRVRTQLVEEVIERSMTDNKPACPGCGTTMVVRSRSTRTVVMQGDQAVRLERNYVVCRACGTGLFPPG